MEGCLRFDAFIFQTLPNLAIYIYIYGLSSLEQHHKIEKKNTHTNAILYFSKKNLVDEGQGISNLDLGLFKLKKPILT